MLRLLIVAGLFVVGFYVALHGPFPALLVYLGNAYFRPDAWVWGDHVSALRPSLVIGTYLVVSVIFARVPLRADVRVLLVAAFFLQSLFSTIASRHPVESSAAWLAFVPVLLITFLITVLVDDRAKLRLAILVVSIALGFEAAKQGFAEMIRNPGGTNANPIVFLGDNNGVGLGMMMLAPFFVLLARTATSRAERLFHLAFLVGVVYRGLSTYSRGAFLAAAAVGLLLFVRSRRKLATLLVALVVLVPPLSLFGERYWERMGTIRDAEESEDASVQGRLHIWRIALVMTSAHPLVGCGFHAFEECYDRHDDSQGEFGERRAVHNSWLGVAAEQGVTGFAIYLAVIAVAGHACIRARRRARRGAAPAELAEYASALEASLVAFLVGGTFLSFHYNEMVWHLFAFTFVVDRIGRGIAAAPAEPVAPPEPRPVAVAAWRPPERAAS